MWLFRLKWFIQHFISSIIALIAGLVVLNLFLPEFVQLPNSPLALVNVLIVAAGIAFVSALVGGFFSSRDVRRELEEITLGAKNLAYGNLGYRLRFTGNAEFDGIIEAFNEMASRLEAQVGALQKLAQENEQLIQETKITAISEERQRLARDLHDAVSQHLFAISMMAATVSRVAENSPEQTLGLIQEISQSATRAQAEMRALLLQLRPITLQNETLTEALASLASELESRQTIACQVELAQITLPKNIENQLFRIAQEGLSNVLRHAEASQVTISLQMSESNNRVLLTIEDDGKGFVMEEIPQSSLGIRSIKERSTLIGATAQWLSVPGQGTRLEIRVPISLDTDGEEE